MAFTTIAYSESQDTAGALTYVLACPDQHVRVEADNIIVPRGMNYLAGAYAVGTTITLAQLESPALRRTVLYDVSPVQAAAYPATPKAIVDMFASPIPLDEDEALRALVAEAFVGAQRETVVVWLADGPLEAVAGEVYTVRATGTTTVVAWAWSNVPLTFTQALPAGRYQVVGARIDSAGLIAGRLVFVGGVWRPGVVGAQGVNGQEIPAFRHGRLGVWGEFEHSQPPSVDILSGLADVAETVWLDIIRIE